MNVLETPIAGISVVETKPFSDVRGSFARLFCADELATVIGGRSIVQANLSHTVVVGAIRGMHFQYPPDAEMKLVRCLRGRVFDVAVDLRADSPTFLRWYAEELTADNLLMLVIPEGCAHGFQALEADTELLYLHTAYYRPSAEGGCRYDDPRLGIRWPLPALDLSTRDCQHALLDANFAGINA